MDFAGAGSSTFAGRPSGRVRVMVKEPSFFQSMRMAPFGIGVFENSGDVLFGNETKGEGEEVGVVGSVVGGVRRRFAKATFPKSMRRVSLSSRVIFWGA